jgi:hypothetical protein
VSFCRELSHTVVSRVGCRISNFECGRFILQSRNTDAFQRWMVAFVVGMTVGLLAFGIDYSIKKMQEQKFDLIGEGARPSVPNLYSFVWRSEW